MTHQIIDDRKASRVLADIVAADEVHPSIARQVFNGFTGTLVLLLTGIVILIMVLWKAP